MKNYQDKQTKLDELFELLKETEIAEDYKAIEEEIWQIWLHHDNPEIDLLMEKANLAAKKGDFSKSIQIYSRVIEQVPDFAEGWNKRATLYFLRGNFKASLDDIEQTLKLENRHFGALSGMISIYLGIGDFRGVLKAFERLLGIYPKRQEFHKQVTMLRDKLRKRK